MDASIAIPIFILIVFSLIAACIFFFSCLNSQTDMHKQLVDNVMNSNATINIERKTVETSKKTGGIAAMTLSRQYSGKIYVINQSQIIRIGGMLDFDQNDEE